MIGIIILIILFVLVFLLQLRLSRMASRWPGLVLPTLGILLIGAVSITNVVSAYNFPSSAIGGADGPTSLYVSASGVPWNTIALLGVYTGGLLLLYLAERKRIRQNRDMDKSRIQDL